MTTREPGYYWIRIRYRNGERGELEVAKYDPGRWGGRADWWTVGQEIPEDDV